MSNPLPFYIPFWQKRYPFKMGKCKTWTPGPWSPSVEQVHGPGPSKYGPGPWTPFHGLGPWSPLYWTGSMDPLFLQVEAAP